MSADARAVTALTILLAVCETSLAVFEASDRPTDAQLVIGVERLIERTRREIQALTGRAP